MPKDYYHILGLEKNASPSEIKKAYRNKAKTLHPDKNTSANAEEEFQELNEAYMVLSDEHKRNLYDSGKKVDQPTFTQEEVDEMLRRQRRNVYSEFQFKTRNEYPPLNYKAYEKWATTLNTIMMFFALSFIVDFFVFADFGETAVEAVYSKVQMTMMISDTNIRLVETPLLTFETENYSNFIQQGDSLFIKKSLFYDNYSYISDRDPNLEVRVQSIPYTSYLFVVLVFLAGSIGLYPTLKAERKFNAAIVSSFFSIVLLVLLLIG